MKLIVSLFLMIVLVTGCQSFGESIKGADDLSTNGYDIIDFDKVKIHSAFDAKITHSDDYGVATTVNENLVEYLIVEKNNDTLTIGLKPTFSFTNQHLECVIAMPNLKKIDVSGASTVECLGFESIEEDTLEVKLSGASKLTGTFKSDTMTIKSSGASKTTLSGQADTIKVKASGASTVNVLELEAQKADIDISGASHVNTYTTEQLIIDASGASKVSYKGTPAIQQDTSGASSVKNINE